MSRFAGSGKVKSSCECGGDYCDAEKFVCLASKRKHSANCRFTYRRLEVVRSWLSSHLNFECLIFILHTGRNDGMEWLHYFITHGIKGSRFSQLKAPDQSCWYNYIGSLTSLKSRLLFTQTPSVLLPRRDSIPVIVLQTYTGNSKVLALRFGVIARNFLSETKNGFAFYLP